MPLMRAVAAPNPVGIPGNSDACSNRGVRNPGRRVKLVALLAHATPVSRAETSDLKSEQTRRVSGFVSQFVPAKILVQIRQLIPGIRSKNRLSLLLARPRN